MIATTIPKQAKRQGMQLIARALAAGRLQTEAKGLENVPGQGPVLLVARHYHHLFDGLALYRVVPREIHILVTLDWATNRLVRAFMESAIRLARWPLVLRADAVTPDIDGARAQKNTIFTEKDVAYYQTRALRDSVHLLRDGKVLLIFPEGYPNIDAHYTPKTAPEEFLPFKSGFAVIATAAEKSLDASLPIVPVGLSYVAGTRWLARVNFGRALYAGDFSSRKELICAVEQDVKSLSSSAGRSSA